MDCFSTERKREGEREKTQQKRANASCYVTRELPVHKWRRACNIGLWSPSSSCRRLEPHRNALITWRYFFVLWAVFRRLFFLFFFCRAAKTGFRKFKKQKKKQLNAYRANRMIQGVLNADEMTKRNVMVQYLDQCSSQIARRWFRSGERVVQWNMLSSGPISHTVSTFVQWHFRKYLAVVTNGRNGKCVALFWWRALKVRLKVN